MREPHQAAIRREARDDDQHLNDGQADTAASRDDLGSPGQGELQDIGGVDGGDDVLHHRQRAERGDQNDQMSRMPPLQPRVKQRLDQGTGSSAGSDGADERHERCRRAVASGRPGEVAAECEDAGMGDVEQFRGGIDQRKRHRDHAKGAAGREAVTKKLKGEHRSVCGHLLDRHILAVAHDVDIQWNGRRVGLELQRDQALELADLEATSPAWFSPVTGCPSARTLSSVVSTICVAYSTGGRRIPSPRRTSF